MLPKMVGEEDGQIGGLIVTDVIFKGSAFLARAGAGHLVCFTAHKGNNSTPHSCNALNTNARDRLSCGFVAFIIIRINAWPSTCVLPDSDLHIDPRL
jgi:hypothetical protein